MLALTHAANSAMANLMKTLSVTPAQSRECSRVTKAEKGPKRRRR